MASGAAWADDLAQSLRAALNELPPAGEPVEVADTPFDQSQSDETADGDPREILGGLVRGLAEVRGNPLLKAFAVHKLDAVPGRRSTAPHRPRRGPGPSIGLGLGLGESQRRAVAACGAAGVQAVLETPGAGGARLIAIALDELTGIGAGPAGPRSDPSTTTTQNQSVDGDPADAGRVRVLLVAPREQDLDAVLAELLGATAAATPVVRVGAQSWDDDVDEADSGGPGNDGEAGTLIDLRVIDLDRQVAVRKRELDLRVAGLTAHLADLDRTDAHLAEVEAEVADFDASAYRLAERRVANREAADAVARRLTPAGIELNEASAAEEQSRRMMTALAFREAEREEARIGADLASVDAELSTPTERSWRARLTRWRTLRRLRGARSALVRESIQAGVELRRTLNDARRDHVDPGLVGVLSRHDVEAAHDTATRRLDEATTHLTRLRREADRVARAGLAGPDDQPLVTGQRRLWELHESLPGLRDRSARGDQERARLHREREQQGPARRPDVRGAVLAGARVLATTFDRLALDPALTTVPFDHVIVLAAGDASLAQVAHAAGRARTGVTLVGTPQSGSSSPVENCFSHFGLTDPATATKRTGCVVLSPAQRPT